MKKKISVIILVIYTVYAAVFLFSCLTIDSHSFHHQQESANSIAKLTYTNASTYLTKCSVEDPDRSMLPDGIYCGCLVPERNAEYSPVFDFTPADFDIFMKELYGRPVYNSGYYCVIIKDGELRHCYFGWDDTVVKKAPQLAASVEKGEPWRGTDFLIGGYPIECGGYKAEPLGEDISSLNVYYEGGEVTSAKLIKQSFRNRLHRLWVEITDIGIGKLLFFGYIIYLIIFVLKLKGSKKHDRISA